MFCACIKTLLVFLCRPISNSQKLSSHKMEPHCREHPSFVKNKTKQHTTTTINKAWTTHLYEFSPLEIYENWVYSLRLPRKSGPAAVHVCCALRLTEPCGNLPLWGVSQNYSDCGFTRWQHLMPGVRKCTLWGGRVRSSSAVTPVARERLWKWIFKHDRQPRCSSFTFSVSSKCCFHFFIFIYSLIHPTFKFYTCEQGRRGGKVNKNSSVLCFGLRLSERLWNGG